MNDEKMGDMFNENGLCALGENSVFSFLCGEKFREISGYFQTKTVKAGETIWEEGGICDYVAIITSGRVEVKKKTEFEGKYVIVGLFNKGAVVGAMCILDDSPRSITAVALEDVSLLVITKEKLDELINTRPEIGVQLLKGMLLSLSIRLRQSFERLSKFF